MSYDPELAKLSAARILGWGLGLASFGAAAATMVLARREPYEPLLWVVLWVGVAAVGWIMVVAGVVRLAEKVDHLYRESAERTSRVSHPAS